MPEVCAQGFDDAEEAVRDALIPDNQKKVYATIVLNQTDTDDIECVCSHRPASCKYLVVES